MSWREDAVFGKARFGGKDAFDPLTTDTGSQGTEVFQVDGMWKFEASLDVGSIAANISQDETFTVTGLLAGDIVMTVNPPTSLNDGLGIGGAFVDADNTLTIRFINSTAGALDPAAGTYIVIIARPGSDLATP